MNNASFSVTAPDNYTAAATIDLSSDIDHFVIDVSNQAIFWQLKTHPENADARAGTFNGVEVRMNPGSRVIDRDGVCGIKVRAAVPAGSLPAGALQAFVTVEAVF